MKDLENYKRDYCYYFKENNLYVSEKVKGELRSN